MGDLECQTIVCEEESKDWDDLSLYSASRAAWLPDALGGVDDGLHYVVSNELPVLLGDVIDRSLCA